MFEKSAKYARVSKLPKEQPEFPYKPATMYRWHHVGKFPEIFLKFNGTLFVDLEALYRLIDAGRTQQRSGSR
jgi:hypothetical protein